MTDWPSDIRAVDVRAAASALGIEPRAGRGRESYWDFCPCGGQSSKGSVHFASVAGRLRCRVCGASWDAMGLLELSTGISLPPSSDWPGSQEVDQIRDIAASLGWCEADRASNVDRARRDAWKLERDRAAREKARRRKEERLERERSGLDVGLAWSQIRDVGAGRQGLMQWALHVRRLPPELIDHLPWGDLAFVGEYAWSPDVRLGSHGGRLVDIARRRGRPIMIALSDGQGAVQSVKTRCSGPTAPIDSKTGSPGPKSLNLSAERTTAGPVADWVGGVCAFGSIEFAVDLAMQGRPLILVEGGPDYVVASALCRWARQGVALGFPGDTAVKRLSDALRLAFRLKMAGRAERRPTVVIVPHTEPRARESARYARAALGFTANVRLVDLPDGQDVNDVVTEQGADALRDLIFGGAEPQAPVLAVDQPGRTYQLRTGRDAQ